MYIFTGSNPDIDGSLDADVVVHEHTHGLSNRLHGNASGLTLDIARGMGRLVGFLCIVHADDAE